MSRGWTDGRTTRDYISSRRRCFPAALTGAGRRQWRRGDAAPSLQADREWQINNQRRAKGNPLFSTPVIISIRCLAPSCLAMISTFKWQRGEGKTNVGSRRQGQRGRNVASRRSKQEAVGLCRLSLTVRQQRCSKKRKKKKKNHLSNHVVESETRVSDRNTNRKPIKVAPMAKMHLRALYSHISKNKFPSPRSGLRHLRVTPTLKPKSPLSLAISMIPP